MIEVSGPTTTGAPHIPTGMTLDGVDATVWAPSSAPVGGQIVEMSPRDLKLYVTGYVKLGTVVELELTSRLFGFSTSVRGQVHWRENTSEGTVVGMFLYRALPHEVVGHFFADLRKELRYDCRWQCGLYTPRSRQTDDARLINYSRSGLLIEAQRSVPESDEVKLFDTNRPEVGIIASGAVCWQTTQGSNRALLGCAMPDEQGVRLSEYLRSSRIMT